MENSVQRHEPVSWRMTATVAAQGMNNIETVRKAIAVAGVYNAARVSARPVPSEAPNMTPKVAIEFSFATKLLSSATVNFQSMPILLPIGSNICPNEAR